MKDNHLNITKNSKLFALKLNIFNPEENFEITKNYFKTENPSDLVINAQKTDCDILALRFNIKNEDEISEAVKLLKTLLTDIYKPLMICGCGTDLTDRQLLPQLAAALDRQNCIISFIQENTYKSILPSVIEGNHYAVLKTPIDINLVKELNILCSDRGLDKSKIIMDTDIGGLGYGFEYGYSIMEKVRLEGEKGDEFLDLPLISDASSESLKTKEAKSDKFSQSWGNLETRAAMIELSAVSGVLSAGANIVLMANPDNISVLKGLV